MLIIFHLLLLLISGRKCIKPAFFHIYIFKYMFWLYCHHLPQFRTGHILIYVCYSLLFYSILFSGCTDDLTFETKTVGVGGVVNLTCPRNPSETRTSLFWIRLVSGSFPEFLGGTYTFDYDGVNETPRITAKQEPGTFLLHISKTELSDTGVYYCMKVKQLDMKFMRGTFLRITGK